jgi:hypothetical protein
MKCLPGRWFLLGRAEVPVLRWEFLGRAEVPVLRVGGSQPTLGITKEAGIARWLVLKFRAGQAFVDFDVLFAGLIDN